MLTKLTGLTVARSGQALAWMVTFGKTRATILCIIKTVSSQLENVVDGES